MAGLLQSSLNRKITDKQVDVRVINLEPETVVSQLNRIGIPHTVSFAGENSVPDFVGSYITEASKYAIKKLQGHLKEQHIEIGQISVQQEIGRAAIGEKVLDVGIDRAERSLILKMGNYPDPTTAVTENMRLFKKFSELIQDEYLEKIIVHRDRGNSQVVDYLVSYSNPEDGSTFLIPL
jgi:hypothetical protein